MQRFGLRPRLFKEELLKKSSLTQSGTCGSENSADRICRTTADSPIIFFFSKNKAVSGYTTKNLNRNNSESRSFSALTALLSRFMDSFFVS